MGDNYRKLFTNLEEIEPSERLFKGIIGQIEFRNRRTAKIKSSLFGIIATASLISIIPAFSYAASEFSQSGIYHYISLIFSDFNLLSVYWKDFLYLIAESFPLIGLTAILLAIFVFLNSFKLALKNIKAAHL